MHTILKATALTIIAFSTQSFAAGSIRLPGLYEDKLLVTIVSHDDLKASSAWKLGDGEPPITSIQAADLAIKSQKSQFPELKNVVIKDDQSLFYQEWMLLSSDDLRGTRQGRSYSSWRRNEA